MPCRGLAYDFISLYPSIIVFGEFPVGHSEILLHSFANISTYFGMVQCRVLSPNDLLVPTLPLRVKDGRTLYSLCPSCLEEVNIAEPCHHTGLQRAFEGAWITPLLHQAIEDGYRALETFEVHPSPIRSVYNPTTKSGGIFADFILAVIRKKIVTSGFLHTLARKNIK